MTDLQKAREMLHTEGLTCALCCGEKVYSSKKPGIAPMLGFIDDGTELAGFSVADRIVGKAVALLFVKAGIKAVFGEVMSVSAKELLTANGIAFQYGKLTDRIINRRGDGICPMEATVLDITDPDEAYTALQAAYCKLQTK